MKHDSNPYGHNISYHVSFSIDIRNIKVRRLALAPWALLSACGATSAASLCQATPLLLLSAYGATSTIRLYQAGALVFLTVSRLY
ncbi:hypothetical protein ACOSQ4_021530 [Xanthoceras sorbifolium]